MIASFLAGWVIWNHCCKRQAMCPCEVTEQAATAWREDGVLSKNFNLCIVMRLLGGGRGAVGPWPHPMFKTYPHTA